MVVVVVVVVVAVVVVAAVASCGSVDPVIDGTAVAVNADGPTLPTRVVAAFAKERQRSCRS